MSPYVVGTRAIRAAVRGHEVEVLAALGIQLNGRAHIRCPFPDHDDNNPSWRWDPRNARAHCTCVERPLSIFDVIGRMEGVDFDAAKARAAELIGRQDLIEEKKGGGSAKMTATALLAPPADRAAPEVPRAYLAHRLGVEPDQAPMPTTPTAGWAGLAFWDPASAPGGKPRLIGQHPCAVFGTVAPDGRQHAHRIYVAPGGRGKADLEGRDPKKSAPLARGTTARGCAVIFGDPDRAPWLLVAEGIETAAAMALAFRDEIATGEAYVAAAISTSGVASFEPWPVTSKVTVCADRDEAKRKSEPGYRAGEQAARKFAKRQQGLDVALALPGAPGGNVDFLDILRRDGADAVRATIEAAKALSAQDDGPDEDVEHGGPVIPIISGALHRSVASAEARLADASRADPQRGVYQRGGALVRIARLPVATVATGVCRAAGTLQILPAGPDFLRMRLTEIVDWRKLDKRTREWVPTDAPADVARTLSEIAGLWPNTPSLTGVVEAPSLRPDGTLLDRPGYDALCGLYFDPGATEFPPIPVRPTKRDAEIARDQLLEVLAGFPFVDEESRAVALALLITPLVRYAVRAAPLTAISAPTMGTGKTLAAHLPAYIATGRAPALMTQADDPQEERKRLLALLLEGSVVTVIDNCERPVRSDLLCTALTETIIRDRILGATRTISVPTTTTWVATGNNLIVEGDLSSRALLCMLDSRSERPEEREFEVNLHELVPTQRGELAAAALTIVRAYLVAGQRQQISQFGRFEDWSRLVREPLLWLGMADPCETRAGIASRDWTRTALGNLLEAWHGAFGDAPQTVKGAIKCALNNDALREALEAVGSDRDGKLNTRKIGKFLAKHEGRIERDYRAMQASKTSGAVTWQCEFREFREFAPVARGKMAEKCKKRPTESARFTESAESNSSNSSNSPNSHPRPAAPPIGTVEDGYRYVGGDPAEEASWEALQ